MGTYVFKWEHPASDVHVTGTFDNWSKSVELKKENGVFSKLVTLPSADEDIFYKFVVDDNWTTDHTAPSEKDSLGNVNNVLRAKDINKLPAGARSSAGEHPNPVSAGVLTSGVGAGATTAALAGQVPLEKDKDAGHVPGAFPDQGESGTQSPINLYPGDIVPDYSTYTSATHNFSSQTPSASKGEQTFGVSPLPATAGASNPIQTKPGEKLPSSDTYTSNTVGSNVKLDKESYEKSDAYPSGGEGAAAYSVPPISNNMIPESSLPIISGANKAADPTISSTAGTNTSTAALAAQVPLSKNAVPDVVKDSQNQAQKPVEATQSSDAVQDKKEVESELKDKVPEQPSTSENRTSYIGGAAAAGAAVLGGAAAYAAGVPASIQKAISDMNSSSDSTAAPAVPETVKESQEAAKTSPEASANPEAVSEKKEMEAQLKSKVPEEGQSGEPAPTTSAATTATAPGTTEASKGGLSTSAAATAATVVSAPVAAVAGSKATENTSSLNAPASTPAKSAATTAQAANTSKADPVTPPKASSGGRDDSRDVSPMSKGPAAAGTSSGKTPEKSGWQKGSGKEEGATPSSSKTGTPGSAATKEEKKKNRRSFFGKIKDKMSHKHQEP